MVIHEIQQGTEEWMLERLGRVTASEFGNLVTPEFKIRTGEMPRKYLYAKLAEAWRGHPLPGFSGSWATDQGELREMDAWNWYALEFDEPIKRVGFIVGDDGRCGCSPDGLIGDDCGIEIKSPESVNHVKYLLENEVPKDYVAQVQFSLYVTGRKRWKFVSYRRKFPNLVLTVDRDEEIMKKIEGALAGFYLAFDLAFEQLNEASSERKANPFL